MALIPQMMCSVPGWSTSRTPRVAASASPVRSCLILRSVAEKDRRLHALLLLMSSGSYLLFDLVAACPGLAVLVSGSCPYDPEVVAPRLLLLLLRRGARIVAAVPVAVAPDCPKDHSVLLHVPQVCSDLAVARPRIRIAALAAVGGLVDRVAAIAERADLFLCSMRGGHEKYASLPLRRHHSRRRAAAGAGWYSVT